MVAYKGQRAAPPAERDQIGGDKLETHCFLFNFQTTVTMLVCGPARHPRRQAPIRKRVCCLLVLDSVTSTPQWIRQPKPLDVIQSGSVVAHPPTRSDACIGNWSLDCGCTSICGHNRQRSRCKDCGCASDADVLEH